MKKSINIFAYGTFAWFCLHSVFLNAQATDATNVRTGGYFLGWDNNGTTGSLEIRNDFDQPINIFNSGSQRAYIHEN